MSSTRSRLVIPLGRDTCSDRRPWEPPAAGGGLCTSTEIQLERREADNRHGGRPPMAIAGTLVSHAEHLVFRGLGRFAVDSGRFPLVRRPARSPLFYIALCSLWLGASSPGRFPGRRPGARHSSAVPGVSPYRRLAGDTPGAEHGWVDRGRLTNVLSSRGPATIRRLQVRPTWRSRPSIDWSLVYGRCFRERLRARGTAVLRSTGVK